MSGKIFRIEELDLHGKRVFIRVDFNVPLKPSSAEGGFEVAENARIVGALATLRFAIDKGAKCILASHLGRPKGKVNPKYSLEPVGSRLSELLQKDVLLADDSVGDGPKALCQQMRPGDVLLLENLRFHALEEENSTEFAHRLSELCDVYVSDAFGTLHRAHASTYALPKLAAQKGIGFLIQQELKFLTPLRDNPKRPFLLVMGGAKVSDKLGVMEHFMPKVDKMVIGGAMAYAFLKAQGREIGKSLCDESQVHLAAKIIGAAEARNVVILLPTDHIVACSPEDSTKAAATEGPDVPAEKMGLDIGPRTLAFYRPAFQEAETIFWNGPMGVFENPSFAQGTFGVARLIAESKALKIAGGGDSAAAISQCGYEKQFDFVSTGGGATLEFLEGKELPGLKVLEVLSRSS
ncbi:MAG: phosphoglycerate kinase [Deltaproteobacteria bacterium]|nr:phosphoglycerate kinase [Deltaproteobacteria bacterium]